MKLSDEINRYLRSFIRTGRNDIILPNIFIGRNEMDVIKITNSDYLIEYEIKISRGDFFNDFKKEIDFYDANTYTHNYKNKHELLKTGQLTSNRFYFVVPRDLIKVEECPKYTGLIYYDDDRWFSQVKNAPILHKNTFTDYREISRTMLTNAYNNINQTTKI